jgi:hypothetical protein
MGPSRLDALCAPYTARRSTVRGATPGEVENLMPACREPFGSRNLQCSPGTGLTHWPS